MSSVDADMEDEEQLAIDAFRCSTCDTEFPTIIARDRHQATSHQTVVYGKSKNKFGRIQ